MTNNRKDHLKRHVIMGAREYGINSVLFRQVVGERLGLNATDMECLGIIFFKSVTPSELEEYTGRSTGKVFFEGLATPSELAKYTGLSSGATTAMLDRLERKKLIERKPNPGDRRSTYIIIKNTAVKKMTFMFASLGEAQDTLVSSYSEQQLELLHDFFKKSITIWEEEREKLKYR